MEERQLEEDKRRVGISETRTGKLARDRQVGVLLSDPAREVAYCEDLTIFGDSEIQQGVRLYGFVRSA
jgi:hypothetical protein